VYSVFREFTVNVYFVVSLYHTMAMKRLEDDEIERQL
jgi:hypothetical protein